MNALRTIKQCEQKVAAIRFAYIHLWQIIVVIIIVKQHVKRQQMHIGAQANVDLNSHFESKTNFLMAFREFVCLWSFQKNNAWMYKTARKPNNYQLFEKRGQMTRLHPHFQPLTVIR